MLMYRPCVQKQVVPLASLLKPPSPLRTRCELYVRLFLHANNGDDVWDEADYQTLGCAEFEPWQLDAGF